ncbi:hypothetical protein JAO71_08535 [Olleya sp. YSTF-M6]|uniref:VWFA domain-containing protein n=2 Tax=Olleya sediminilitoris TaxID=2795739 RepID=A0ABS1WL57_9FLAO|nr:hypothetical protein [Olleya sediminilitoris]
MKNKINIFFLLLIVVSCKEDVNKGDTDIEVNTKTSVSHKSKDNLNISFLLDLSDRISPEKYPNSTMEYYRRDIAYIKSVSEAFDMHLRGKKVRAINDKMQLYFDPEPSNQNINTISNSLKYSLDKKNVTLSVLDDIKESYASKPQKIYDLAIADNKYVGSDTWRFFKSKVNDYCIEENYRNILVVLTDGYIYHKNTKIKEDNLTTYLTPSFIREVKLNNKNWESKIEDQQFGFIPAVHDLSNLEILVLGINPDNKNPYEEDLIKKYWSDWFDAMKVRHYQIKTSALPSNLDKIIKNFILNN